MKLADFPTAGAAQGIDYLEFVALNSLPEGFQGALAKVEMQFV
jgi:hypothetical protein